MKWIKGNKLIIKFKKLKYYHKTLIYFFINQAIINSFIE